MYFNLSIVLSGGLLALWTRSHPTVVEHIQNPLVADVAQAYTLAAVALLQGSNRFIIGPLTSKYVSCSHCVICLLKFSSQHFRTMFQRHKLEKTEGKSYTDAGVSSIRSQSTAMLKQFLQVSDEMKAITRRFAQLHGISSLANLFSFFAVAFHGLWIANKGFL